MCVPYLCVTVLCNKKGVLLGFSIGFLFIVFFGFGFSGYYKLGLFQCFSKVHSFFFIAFFEKKKAFVGQFGGSKSRFLNFFKELWQLFKLCLVNVLVLKGLLFCDFSTQGWSSNCIDYASAGLFI